MGPRNHVLDGFQDGTNRFASSSGEKSAMRPFTKLLWTLVETRSDSEVAFVTSQIA